MNSGDTFIFSQGGKGGGGTPGGTSGQIQANQGGAFAGIPGSTVDFTNGLVGLAPTGTGIALTIKGDAHSSPAVEFLSSTGLTSGGYVSFVVPNGSTAFNVFGKNPSGTAQFEIQGFTSLSGTNSFLVSATSSHVLVNTTSSAGGSIDSSCSSITDLTLTDASGEIIDLLPSLGIAPPQYTVATLPAGVEGYIAYATNGRKVGEGGGSGTGVPVYFSNSEWRVFSTDAQVTS